MEGIVTNVVPYGCFVHVDENTTGLIHISEITHGFVSNIHEYANIGQRMYVKVLDVDGDRNQLRLSLKGAPKQVVARRTRRPRFAYQKKQLLPPSRIGFNSIEEKMPQWIKEYQFND